MINATSEVICYEVDGKETLLKRDCPKLVIKNHWNVNDFVVLDINGKQFTVCAKDLQTAIDNATNSARF